METEGFAPSGRQMESRTPHYVVPKLIEKAPEMALFCLKNPLCIAKLICAICQRANAIVARDVNQRCVCLPTTFVVWEIACLLSKGAKLLL